jgi:Skp family chaperone for outer membrane proteins
MKHAFITSCLAILFAASVHAEELNIVTIDIGEVLKQYPAALTFEKDMKNKAEEYKSKRMRMVEEMKKLENNYLEARKASRSSAFSEEKRQEKMKEAEDFLVSYKEMEMEMRESRVKDSQDIQEYRTLAFKQVVDALRKDIAIFAAKNKYDFVFDSSGITLRGIASVLYSPADKDVTEAFLKGLSLSSN